MLNFAHCILNEKSTWPIILLPFFERELAKLLAQKNFILCNKFFLSKKWGHRNLVAFWKFSNFGSIISKIEFCAHYILNEKQTWAVILLPFFERELSNLLAQRKMTSCIKFFLTKITVIWTLLLFESSAILAQKCWILNFAHTEYWTMKQQKLKLKRNRVPKRILVSKSRSGRNWNRNRNRSQRSNSKSKSKSRSGSNRNRNRSQDSKSKSRS